MSRYDRRPLREWDDDRTTRRTATQQVGAFRLVGFVVILLATYVVFRNFGTDPTPTTPTSGSPPRVAIDAALAPVLRARLPHAQLTVGTSDELAMKVREGTPFDATVLGATQTAALASAERCSDAQPVAAKGSARYATCLVNAAGSSRALAAAAVDALTDLDGRSALLDAGFDVPTTRPEPLRTTPTETTPTAPAANATSP